MEEIFLVALVLLLFFCCYIYLPVKMAKKRGRSAVGWVLVFFIISPLWGSIVLGILGDSKKKIKKEILDAINQNKTEILGEISKNRNEAL